MYEPRVSSVVVRVEANPDGNSLTATVTFYVLNSTQLTTVDMLLERAR
jgi:hypothetical protein